MRGKGGGQKNRSPAGRRFCLKKEQAVCIGASVILFGVAQWINGGPDLEGGKIKRGSPGSGETQYEILVNGLGEEKLPLEIFVSSRIPGEKEAREHRREIMDQLPAFILQDNCSLSEVRSDLNLISRIEDQGIRLEWESDDPEIIDSFGTVCNQNISEEGENVGLTVRISDEAGESDFYLPVTVLPPVYTQSQLSLLELSRQIEDADIKSRQQEYLVLPQEYRGSPLTYQPRPDRSLWLIPFLGIAAAAFYGLKEPVRRNEREKKRKESLLLEYSEMVSKLQIYLGAGMTVRTAWERMAKDYQEQMSRIGEKGKKQVYEEVLKTCADFCRGVPEKEAYRQFGRRCGLQPYLKLSSLLEQNQKTGLKNLRQLLDEDVADAFEERKNMARRQGEEAGTKLLLPMFMMLGIVMVIVAVPAFMSFY